MAGQPDVAAPCVAFLALACLIACTVGELGPSVFLTLAAMSQGLAVALLWCGASSPRCLASYSAQSLAILALSLMLRLSSTLWLNGYLPVDSTGDGLYQAVDVCTLVAATALLRRVLRHRRRAGDAGSEAKAELAEEELGESEPGGRLLAGGIIGAFLVAVLLHGDMNSHPAFDALWLAGHILGAAASLPQLRLGLAPGRRAEAAGEACASHFIAAMALGQLFTVTYMWMARDDISCRPWIEGFNHTIWAIIAPSALHLALVSDSVPQLPSL